jgi:hypothetical protein
VGDFVAVGDTATIGVTVGSAVGVTFNAVDVQPDSKHIHINPPATIVVLLFFIYILLSKIIYYKNTQI